MAGWIKMALGTEVDLSLGHIVLDGNSAPLKGAQQPPPPLFGQCLLWPNGRPSQLLLYSNPGQLVRAPTKSKHLLTAYLCEYYSVTVVHFLHLLRCTASFLLSWRSNSLFHTTEKKHKQVET